MEDRRKKLIERSLTALVFAALVLWMVFFNDLTRYLLLWIVGLLCSFEYLRIRSTHIRKPWALWALALVVGPLLSILNYFDWFVFSSLLPVVLLSVIYQLYLGGRLFFSYTYAQQQMTEIFSAFLYIGLPLLLLNQSLTSYPGESLLITLLLVIWASDTFAYLVGSFFGKHKLLPSVSPKKTIEGALGGLLFALVTAWVLFYFWPLASLPVHLGLGFVIWLFGLTGDLVESHLKRHFGVKDSGRWLPGHGGFLDRFDAFVYLIPFVLLYLLLF